MGNITFYDESRAGTMNKTILIIWVILLAASIITLTNIDQECTYTNETEEAYCDMSEALYEGAYWFTIIMTVALILKLVEPLLIKLTRREEHKNVKKINRIRKKYKGQYK